MKKFILKDGYREFSLAVLRSRTYREMERTGAALLLERDCVEAACREEGPERIAAALAEKAWLFGESAVFKGVYEAEDGLELVFTSPGRGDVTFSLYWMADAPACDCKRYLDDISLEEAEAAFANPDLGSGAGPVMVRREYTDFLQQFHDRLETVLAGKRLEKRREAEFQAFREGLKLAYRAYLKAEKRRALLSLKGLSGAEMNASFARARKRSRITEMRHLHVEMYVETSMEAVKSASRSGSPDDHLPVRGESQEKMYRDLKALKALHASMVEVNRVLRRAGKERARQEEGLRGLGLDERMAGKVLERDALSNIGFPSYSLFRSLGRIKLTERLLDEAMAKEEA